MAFLPCTTGEKMSIDIKIGRTCTILKLSLKCLWLMKKIKIVWSHCEICQNNKTCKTWWSGYCFPARTDCWERRGALCLVDAQVKRDESARPQNTQPCSPAKYCKLSQYWVYWDGRAPVSVATAEPSAQLTDWVRLFCYWVLTETRFCTCAVGRGR